MKGFYLKALALLLGLTAAGVLIATIMIAVIYPKLPGMDELRNYQPKLPLQVYSADNILLGQFGQERRIFISYNQTPKALINAILAAEDERFFKHQGFDIQGIIRAALGNLIPGHVKSGASTITMQVARNFFLSSQKTYYRKFNEVLLSYKIEKSLSKEQILELYINQIYLGQRAYGFAEAALTYFGKPLDKLSIAQYAVLAGLPKAPSAYNPVVNKKRSDERKIYVLGRMKINNTINENEYQKAIREKISVVHGSTRDSTDSGGYISEMVRQMLFAKYGDKIYTQGYKVYTTIDSKMQQAAYSSLRSGILQYDATTGYKGAEGQLNISDSNAGDSLTDQIITSEFDDLSDFGDLIVAIVLEADNNHVKVRTRDGNELIFTGKDLDFIRKFINSGGDKQVKRGAVIRIQNNNNKWRISQMPAVEGALISINPNDGSIRSLIGGFDFTKNNFNHVIQAKRQPGSSFKPFIYSAALENNLSAKTIIDDSPVCYPDNGSQWCPRNDENNFLGPISLRQALTLSRNVATVKILNKITPQNAIMYATKFGFDKAQFQPYLTMALGAFDVTPIQMAAAYAVFANGGYLVQPYFIQKITDNNGTVLAQTQDIDIHSTQPVIDPRNAYIMNSIMQDVVRYGTGRRAYGELKRDDIAGKTGTTTDAKDVWFDGYTPNLVTITWIGYDQPKSLGAHQYGATLALPIWINFMRQALKNTPQTSHSMPQGIIVIPHSTWKNNDEYIYANSSPLDNLESETTTNESSSNGKDSASGVAAVSPEAILNGPDTNNQAKEATGNKTGNKPENVDDLINNIQD
ncbi:MAG: penicillin-binding protein [Burkholderiales bacterium]|jgi:penicillin-binding protein 1A|nr:penicillin-binding protein [Burkholderiales bacterium]